MKLLENFKTEYTIITGVTPCEYFAGRELRDFLYSTTAVIFTMTEISSRYVGDTVISIGKTKAFDNSQHKDLLKDVKDDGFVTFVEDKSIFICGNNDRGTLNGVYDFIEKYCGVRFLSETETFVSQLDTVEVPDNLCKVDNPSFAMRVYFTGIGVRNAQFMARQRLSSPYMYEGDVESFGGNFDEWASSSVHTMPDLVPLDKYKESHPEWFARTDIGKSAWFCLTNGLTDDGKVDESMQESVVKTVISQAKQAIANNPKVKYFLIGQSDSDHWCKCQRCQEFYERFNKHYWWENEGVMATSLLFTNCVAEEIEKWLSKVDPDRKVLICTLSYRGTLHPPIYKDEQGNIVPVEPLLIPRNNVGIFYCASGGCATHLLGDPNCIKATRTADDLNGWKALGANLLLYDYSTCFNNTIWYYPYLRHLTKQLKLYKELGVQVMYRQALHIEGKNFDTLLQQYLYSKAFWNVDFDFEFVLNEFFEKYFHKDIAPFIHKYFDIMESAVYNVDEKINSDIHSAMYIEQGNHLYDGTVFTKDVLLSAMSVIEQAMDSVNKLDVTDRQKNTLQTKLTSILIQPEMMLLAHYTKHFGNTQGRAELQSKFVQHLKRIGTVMFAEGGKFIKDVESAENIEEYLTNY